MPPSIAYKVPGVRSARAFGLGLKAIEGDYQKDPSLPFAALLQSGGTSPKADTRRQFLPRLLSPIRQLGLRVQIVVSVYGAPVLGVTL